MWGRPVKDGPFDVDDLAAGLIRFDNGASLIIQVSWAANTSDSADLRVMGTKGGIEMDPGKSLKVLTEDNGFLADVTPQYRKSDAFAAQHAQLIECIRDDTKPLRNDGRHGVVLQAMLDGIYASAVAGHEVAITVPQVVPRRSAHDDCHGLANRSGA